LSGYVRLLSFYLCWLFFVYVLYCSLHDALALLYSKKGLTIEYVMLMMVVVALFVVVILFAVGRGTTIANGYRTYVERKAFLDDEDRKSTRLNSSQFRSRMPSSA